MAGFFDLSDPDNAAMLGMAVALLQAGAPSRLPVPLGAALGSGLAGGLNAGLAAQRAQAARQGQWPTARQAALRQLTAGAPAVSYGQLLPWQWLPSGRPW